MKLYAPFYSLGFLLLLASCSKEEGTAAFSAQPSVYFIYSTSLNSIANMDSTTYSFVEKSSTLQQDTLWLPVRIAGNTADHDRPISLVPVADSSTAVANVHYRLLDYSLPKNAFQTRLGVVLLRDASLQQQAVSLTLRLQPTADFPVLMKEGVMMDGFDYSRNKVRIVFSDKLIKPSNWDTYIATFFGAYSDVKYRFVAATLGVSSFPNTGPNALKFPQMQYYQTVMRNALVAYNAANGTMKDENGQPVVFP